LRSTLQTLIDKPTDRVGLPLPGRVRFWLAHGFDDVGF
jgi:hypothetical protein